MEEQFESEKIQLPDPSERIQELLEACQRNDTKSAKDLIHFGVPLTEFAGKTCWTPLHFASLHGNEELVLELIKFKASEPYRELKSNSIGNKLDSILMKNTPLHWAAFNGHVHVCWSLVEASYDPDDEDSVGNTCLHLAAANNHIDVVKILLKCGANPSAMNIFSHTPLDLTTSYACRELLRKATTGSGDKTALKFTMRTQNLQVFQAAQEEMEKLLSAEGNTEDICSLVDAIAQAQEMKVNSKSIASAKEVLDLWNARAGLTNWLEKVSQTEPVISQSQYCNLVNRLQASKEKAEDVGLTGELIERAENLIKKSHAEYWLKKACERLENLTCASSKNLLDMEHLSRSIEKAELAGAHSDLINISKKLLSKLTCEVDVRTILDTFPEVRLPQPEMPRDYWKEEDIGYVQQTELYPLPEENGEYNWIHSQAYVQFNKAYDALKKAIEDAELYGANPDTIVEAKAKEKEAAGTSKVLAQKDETDKANAVAAARKLAKKQKAKKK